MLGAGFGGLELSSRLSSGLGEDVEVTVIDRSDAFVFGFSKLELMFGRKTVEEIRIPYSDLSHPRIRFRQETITSIEPESLRVTTDLDTYEADVLVVALGAGYHVSATSGLAEIGHEFYSVAGAAAVHGVLQTFDQGTAIVGVCGPSFKCPPAPSEAALLLDEYLRERGVRERTEIKLVMPFGLPIPPSPESSQALLTTFADRGIEFIPNTVVSELDPQTSEAVLRDGRRLQFELFLGIPVHRVPRVVQDSGLAVDGWIPVDPGSLATRFPNVFAVGDVTSVGTAKAGVFSEGQAKVVADQLIARLRSEPEPPGYDGTAACYIEFGERKVARVDVDFFSTPGHPHGTFSPASEDITREKAEFATVRRARWFGH